MLLAERKSRPYGKFGAGIAVEPPPDQAKFSRTVQLEMIVLPPCTTEEKLPEK
jgi:hypothetical protein